MKIDRIILIVNLLCTGLFLTSGCTKKSESTIDQIMNADKNFKFPPGFPPDPGEAGKKTLEGIDSDHDGLRDDIQRWIYARFPNDPKKRGALRQDAINTLQMLLLTHNPGELEKMKKGTAKASACLFETFLDSEEAYNEGRYIEAKVVNTKDRIRRYLEVNHWFDDTTSSLYPKDATACE